MGARRGLHLSPDLFNLYSEAILRKLEVLSVFNNGLNKLNKIRYIDIDSRHRK